MKKVKKAIKKFLAPRYQKLHATKFGLAGGIVCGVSVLLTTLATAFWGMFPSFTGVLIDLYGFLGFSPTPFGAFLGLVYGFIDGFIGFFVLGWIYNRLL
jgi:hypothetical protein